VGGAWSGLHRDAYERFVGSPPGDSDPRPGTLVHQVLEALRAKDGVRPSDRPTRTTSPLWHDFAFPLELEGGADPGALTLFVRAPTMGEDGALLVRGVPRAPLARLIGTVKGAPPDLDRCGVLLVSDVLSFALERRLTRLARALAAWRDGRVRAGRQRPRTYEIHLHTARELTRPEASVPVDDTCALARLCQLRAVVRAIGVRALDGTDAKARDNHPSHFGRLCPVDTPESKRLGLSLQAAGSIALDHAGNVASPGTGRHRSWHTIGCAAPGEPSGPGVLSVSAALIPFAQHDDPTRALMGAKNLRQALPLARPEIPLVASGTEAEVAGALPGIVRADLDGEVVSVEPGRLEVRYDDGTRRIVPLRDAAPTRTGTCTGTFAAVKSGARVRPGDLLAHPMGVVEGRLAIGVNLTVAYMTWEGYTYEDAIVASERLRDEDALTSLHVQVARIPIGPGERCELLPLSPGIPMAPCDPFALLKRLKGQDVLRVPPGWHDGELVRMAFEDAGPFSGLRRDATARASLVERPRGHVVLEVLARARLEIGDKLMNRHGNKGVVGRFVPRDRMPRMPDATPVDLIFSPFGPLQRKNLGQIYETQLGLALMALASEESRSAADLGHPFHRDTRGALARWLDRARTAGASWARDGITPDGKVRLSVPGRAEPHIALAGPQYIVKLVHRATTDGGEPSPASRNLISACVRELMATGLFASAAGGRGRRRWRADSALRMASGKHGFIRQHLLARRVDFSGRGVLVPDWDLEPGELRVGERLLERLLWPFLSREARQASGPSGRAGRRAAMELLVDRCFPWVLLNRNPSLHRFNIQAFRPRIGAGSAIGIFPPVLGGLAGDFDGDTAALHLLVTATARGEAPALTPARLALAQASPGSVLSFGHELAVGTMKRQPGMDLKPSEELARTLASTPPDERDRLLVERCRAALAAVRTADLSVSVAELERLRASEAAAIEPFRTLIRAGVLKDEKRLFAEVLRGLGVREDPVRVEVRGNYLDGLTARQFFDAAHLARARLCDKKLRTADAGYLMRKLVALLAPARVTVRDCRATRGLTIPGRGSQSHLAPWWPRLLAGRVALASDPPGLIERGDVLTAETLTALVDRAGALTIRSPAHCRATDGVCARCMGQDLVERELPAIGTLVGLRAAQSIGERGTQGAMKTFKSADDRDVKLVQAMTKLLKAPGTPADFLECCLELYEDTVASVHLELLMRSLADTGGELRSLGRVVRERPEPFSKITFEKMAARLKSWAVAGSEVAVDHPLARLLFGGLPE
jgi:hypothetical protein